MRNLICLLQICLLFFVLNSIGKSQAQTGPPPGWVQSHDFTDLKLPGSEQYDALYYLLVDVQLNLVENEFYTHFIYQVKSSEEVQYMSDISVDIDPEFEELVFHKVNIIRNGKVINQLSSPKIKSIQREQNMDKFIYDGSITSLINLTDVRRGDFIEYAYTTKGVNPVFDGLYSAILPLQYYVPISNSSYRILVDSKDGFQLNFQNTDIKPKETNVEKVTEYAWSWNDIPPIEIDNSVPAWYTPGKQVQISNATSWKEINQWAEKHFSVSENDLNFLADATRDKFKGDNSAELALQITNFVQDEVRYLGFEHGLNSHQPHSPREVLHRRFGDCKDKSLLLSSLLNINGIEAHPVLVNTTMGKVIPEFLPGIYSFDHSVVQYRIGGETFYIDPTVASQGGWGYSRFFPNYYFGLVIGESGDELSKLPLSDNSRIVEEMKFSMWEIGGSVRMEVTTVYSGLSADRIRSDLNIMRRSEVQKEYLEYYSHMYPDIDVRTDMSISDIRDQNILTVYEDYVIVDFWKKKDGEGLLTADVYPQTLSHYIEPSQSGVRRTSPYSLQFPLEYEHQIEIHLPEAWSVEKDAFTINSPHYEMNHSITYGSRVIQIKNNYITLSDHIPIEDFPDYVKDHRKMMDNLHFNLSYQPVIAGGRESANFFSLFLILIGVILGGLISYKLYQYDPEPNYDGKYGTRNFSGFQIFALVILIIWVGSFLYDLIFESSILNISWMLLVESLGVLMWPLFVFDFLFKIIFLFFMGTTIVLFIKKRSSTPQLMSIFFLVALVYNSVFWILDTTGLYGIGTYSNFFTAVLPSMIIAILFILYFHFSDVVSDTFTKRFKAEKPQKSEVGSLHL